MKLPEKYKKIAGSTVYTMGGTLLMNGVLQLFVNPMFNRIMGDERMGDMLYITGLVSVLCPSIGQSLNNSRLVVRRDRDVTNGDYNTMLLLFGGLGTFIILLFTGRSFSGRWDIPLTALLMMLTIFRYYGDVEYRLNLNYRKYFVYYACVSAGYVLGFLLYRLTDNWFLVYMTGEGAAILYTAATGSIYKRFLYRSPHFKTAVRRGSLLIVSYLITNTTLNLDRLMLKHLLGPVYVTRYYVVSLIGKTLVLVVAPINTVMISYLSRKGTKMGRREFIRFAGLGLLVAAAFFVFAEAATPVFVRIAYGADMYAAVKSVILSVNIVQILSLLSAYLFMLVLPFTKEYWQVVLQGAHMVIFVAAGLLLTGKYGMMGFIGAALAANLLRVAAVMALGFVKIK